ncbi:aldose 1-epimerase [Gordonia sp. (in: high G+C Gram-positive bacteria)]|uniref:aldose epimerase family protein n=1 Tax=Gordonia sp. (in: high G+C Gram-positive bacteria) TaxID=84139 RepID=UPI003C781E98
MILQTANARLDLSLDGGVVERLRVGDLDLLTVGPGKGSFPMIPWCGRLDRGILTTASGVHHLPRNAEPHAIHGTARDDSWRLVESTATTATIAQSLTAPWPFAGTTTASFTLDDDALTMSLEVASDSESFPAQAGWHPWFRRTLRTGSAPVELSFDADWQELRGDDYLPSGTRITPLPGPWDDCFGMPGGVDVKLLWPGIATLRIQSPEQWVVVYDLEDDSVCIEPQSGPPNGVNTMPRTVTPSSPLLVQTRWSWETL